MSFTAQEALTRIIEHREIFHDEMLDLMRQIMGGQLSPVMIAAIIVGIVAAIFPARRAAKLNPLEALQYE